MASAGRTSVPAGCLRYTRGVQSPTNAQIRAWARDNGLAVSDRGRLPARVLDAYAAAHGEAPVDTVSRDTAPTGTAPVPPSVVPGDLAPAPPVAVTAAPEVPAQLDTAASADPPAADPDATTGSRWRSRRALPAAIAALVVLSLIGAATYFLQRDDDEPTGGSAGATGDVGFEALRLGDCTAEIPQGVTLTVRLLPCDEPHEGEVYASFDLSGDDYPGNAGVERFALGGCQRQALTALPPDDETLYDLVYLAPSAQTWARGDRTVSCVLSDPTGRPLVGSVVAGTAQR